MLAAASKRHSTVWRRALREQKSASTRCRSAGRSAASCNKTSGRRRVLPSRSSRILSSAGFRLQVAHNIAFDDWARLAEGAYLLRSNISDWSDQHHWKAYIQLTQAEAAFRIHKDQLNVRPIWHQRQDRVQAHILVCFLAFVLWKSLEMWQQRAGLGNSPRTVLEELARIQSHDVVLPTTTHGPIPPALRHSTRRRPSGASRSPRHHSPQAHAPRRIRVAGPRDQRLTNPTLSQNVVATFWLVIVLPKAYRRFCASWVSTAFQSIRSSVPCCLVMACSLFHGVGDVKHHHHAMATSALNLFAERSAHYPAQTVQQAGQHVATTEAGRCTRLSIAFLTY